MIGKLKVLVPPLRVAVEVNVMVELPPPLTKLVPLAVRLPLTEIAVRVQRHLVTAGEGHGPGVAQRRFHHDARAGSHAQRPRRTYGDGTSQCRAAGCRG